MINNFEDFIEATNNKVTMYNRNKKMEVTFEKCRTLVIYNVGKKVTLAISPQAAYELFQFYKTYGFDVV